MARLVAKERVLFYPTSTVVASAAAKLIKPLRSGGRLLDPCSGTGEPAAVVAKAIGATSYGVEISYARCDQSKANLNVVFNAAYSDIQISDDSMNVVFNNPPYDNDSAGVGKRLEYAFLRDTTPKLGRGGVMIYIVGDKMLHNSSVVLHFSNNYENWRVYEYPDTAYGQVMLIANRRKENLRLERVEDCKEYLTAVARPPLPIDDIQEPVFSAEVAPLRRRFFFYEKLVSHRTQVDSTVVSGVRSTRGWKDIMVRGDVMGQMRHPLMPLKIGHIAMILASGALGLLELKDEDTGRTILVKGRAVKYTEKVDEVLDPDTEELMSEKFLDKWETTIVTIDQHTITVIKSVEDLSKFMQKFGQQIGEYVSRKFSPLYSFDPDPRLWEETGKLSLKGKRLPGAEHVGLLPAQRHTAISVMLGLQKYGSVNLQGEMGTGKASRISARVYTPDGYKLMGDIRKGDFVINPDGRYARVIGVYPQGVMDIYRVTFSDGSFTDVTEDHLWTVNSPLRKWRGRPWQVKSLREIASKPLVHETTGNYQVFIPMTTPVEFERKNLPLDPYLMGALLGDGGLSRGGVAFTSADQEILDRIKLTLPKDVLLKQGSKYGYYITTGTRGNPSGRNSVLQILKSLGLMGHRAEGKFIPKEYLYSSVDDRIALLQGLMDTDGCVVGGYGVEYTSVSERLANDVVELVQSLGGTAALKEKMPTFTHQGIKKNGQLAYRLYIKLPTFIVPFSLSRKISMYKPLGKYEPHRSMVSVEYIGRDYAQCIKLDSENELYLTDNYIVTHNSRISASAAYLVGVSKNKPGMVICDPTMRKKWIREIEETIPGGVAVELRKIGRIARGDTDIFGEKYKIQEDRKGQLYTMIGGKRHYQVNDVEAFFEACRSGKLGDHPFAIVSHSTMSISAGWHKIGWLRARLDGKQHNDGQARVRCPKCGYEISIEKKDETIRFLDVEDMPRMVCDNLVSGWQTDRDESGQRIWGLRECGSPMYAVDSDTEERRESVANYIHARYKGAFNILIADEAHRFKSQSTDRGLSFYQLSQSAKYTISMTGTFFGGKSTSVFWLLYRNNPKVRDEYAFNDSGRWASVYGVQMTIRSRKEGKADRWGRTGNARYVQTVVEKPGVGPAIVSHLLHNTIFLTLADIGLPLPPYEESSVLVDPTPLQGRQYEAMDSRLFSVAKETKNWSSWLQWCLARLDSAFRDEQVTQTDENDQSVLVMDLPRVFEYEQTLPKEEWLIKYIQEQKAKARKTLIYVRLTGERNMLGRLEDVLTRNGIRTAVLESSVSTIKREAWIEKRAKSIDALIVNPKLVETGLDLVMFQNVIFFQIEYSLYTLWQAVRRVWRLGQSQPVDAWFVAYRNSMEHRALSVMGKKMGAAQMVYGEQVGGAIVETDEGDLLFQLTRDALAKADIADINSLFSGGKGQSRSYSPTGDLTHQSAPVLPQEPPVSKKGKFEATLTWEEWKQNYLAELETPVHKARVKKQEQERLF